MKIRVTPFIDENDIEDNASISKTFDNLDEAKTFISMYWREGYNTMIEPIEEGE